jgi:predicted glycoside hydrolase/deacetylase ChbG (UPF0249 family)
LTSSFAAIAVAQNTWAERLGYPAETKVLILHANDLGVAYEFNRPIEDALQSGALTSASVVTAAPWFGQCKEWAQGKQDLDVGVSLSFVNPKSAFQWGPVAPDELVPSLMTPEGCFTSSRVQFAVRAEPDHVRYEAMAQVQRARAAGLQPTHLHPHIGALLTRPDLMQLYLDLATELWIPAVMVEFTPDVVERLAARGITINEDVLEAASHYALPRVDDVQHVPPAASYNEKRDALFALIHALPPGITQITLNPADDTPGLHCLIDQWQDRVWDAQLLSDPAVREKLQAEKVLLTNWREIMQRFEASHQGGTE